MNNELWIYVGPVTIGHYPYEYIGFAIESEKTHTKIGTTITPQFAAQIINEHNKIILYEYTNL